MVCVTFSNLSDSPVFSRLALKINALLGKKDRDRNETNIRGCFVIFSMTERAYVFTIVN